MNHPIVKIPLQLATLFLIGGVACSMAVKIETDRPVAEEDARLCAPAHSVHNCLENLGYKTKLVFQ